MIRVNIVCYICKGIFCSKQRDVAIIDSFSNNFNSGKRPKHYQLHLYFIVNHSFSINNSFELFTYILSMVTLKSGIILDQNNDGPLKLANGPNPIQYMQIT